MDSVFTLSQIISKDVSRVGSLGSAISNVFNLSNAAAPTEALSNRCEALNSAKNDAGVLTSQQPQKQENVPLTYTNGKTSYYKQQAANFTRIYAY